VCGRPFSDHRQAPASHDRSGDTLFTWTLSLSPRSSPKSPSRTARGGA
jgi:hypothetical protein